MTLNSHIIPNFKKIWQVSLPIMFSMLAQEIIVVTDTAFMGHVGEVQQGAAAIAGIYYYVLFMLGFGFATGMQIFISRRNGEKNFTAIGKIVENGIAFLWFIAAILIVISLVFTPFIFSKIISHANVQEAANQFIRIRVYGLVFAFVTVAFRAFHVGTTNTRPLSYSSIITAIANIGLNYLLVFGKLGLPAMGLKGSAIASVIAECIGAAFLILYNSRAVVRQTYHLFHFERIDFAMLKRMLDVSIFVMLQYFISLSTWLSFFLIIEKTGEQNLASSSIIRSLYGFIAIPVWAYAASVSSFVSNAIGAGAIDVVPAIIRKTVKTSIITALIITVPVAFFATPILSIFTNNAELAQTSITSLYVVLTANIVFSLSIIPFSGLSGTGKTKVALAIEIIALVLYINSVYLLTHFFAHNIAYIWFSEYAYWGTTLILALLYFRFGKWREVKL